MSKFDQKNQNIDKQINIAGNLNLSSETEKPGIVWITVVGTERYFSSWAKRASGGQASGVALLSLDTEPDLIIFLHHNDGCTVYNGKVNVGDKIKFNIKPGEYQIACKWNATMRRLEILQEVNRKSLHGENLRSSPMEDFLFSCRVRDSLFINSAIDSYKSDPTRYEKSPVVEKDFFSSSTIFRFPISSGEVIDLEWEKEKFRYKH